MTSHQPPLIPPEICDLPTQRLYVASFITLFQSYKLFQFIEFWWFGSSSGSRGLWIYWSSLDFILVGLLIPFLRIPRLRFGILQRIAIVSLLVSINWIFVGNWQIGLSLLTSFLPQSVKRLFDYQTAVLEVKVRLQDVINPSSHILGKHTIHILPHSTAKLNPSSHCFCISSAIASSVVSIPIIFNNSVPHLLQYSVTNFTTGEKTLFNLTHAQLHPLSRQKKTKKSLELWIEDEGNEWFTKETQDDHMLQAPLTHHQSKPRPESGLERTQHLYNLDIRQIGLIRLERVLDEETMDIRIARTEALVVECPRASFLTTRPSSSNKLLSWVAPGPSEDSHKCVDETEDFGMVVRGLAPLSLSYHRIIDGQRTLMKLEGISPNDFISPLIATETATLSEKLRTSHRKDYLWAESKSIDIPLNVSLTTPGKHIYELDSLQDACGHKYDFNVIRDSGASKRLGSQHEFVDAKSVNVHPRSQVSFLGCGNTEDEPLRLLQGRNVPLKLYVKELNGAAGSPWTVGVSYKPTPGQLGSSEDTAMRAWEKNITFSESVKVIQASQPGTYEITHIQGKFCAGDILVPSTCVVAEQPLPTIDLNFTSITDQCSGDIGLKANFLLTGKPPFKLHYLISQVGRSTQKKVKIIQHSRDEIFIQPDSPGQFEYRFIQLGDQFYDDVKIIDKSIKQIVHPLAQAKFVKDEKNIWSCSGETVQAELELKGAPPYTIVYQILGEKPATVTNIETARSVLDIAIPPQYITKGGSFTLSLVSITDGNGCLRNLTVPDLNIEVHRTKPTARFYSADDQRKLIGREGERVQLPLRLTGNGPWTIDYTRDGSSDVSSKKVFSPNAYLEVTHAGSYELLAVHDQHCPGTIDSHDFVVQWLPRPSLSISSQDTDNHVSGSLIKPAVCELVDDSLQLILTGSPPFSVKYSVLHKPFARGERSAMEEKTVQLLKSTSILPLHTTEAGSYTYKISALGDRTYPDLSPNGLKTTREAILQVKQDVFALPTAVLKTLPQTTYCVNEVLSLTQNGKGVRVELTGKPPFQVQLEVKNEVTHAMESFEFNLTSPSTVLSIPYTFRSASPHSVTLTSVRDGNGCSSQLEPGLAGNSAMLEVAEIASIKAVSNKPYFCVGERLEYLLKGSPPWLIKYEFNSKKSSITIHSKEEPKFSRLANEPGLFKIVGIAHKEDLCTAKVNLEKTIRPIPSVKISSGRNFIEDIREGDQSEIVFSFEGTPPFSFTYTRSLPQDRTTDARILETRTVTDIQDHTYSIFAREEGTWSVTYVQDAYCSFPPLSSTAMGSGGTDSQSV